MRRAFLASLLASCLGLAVGIAPGEEKNGEKRPAESRSEYPATPLCHYCGLPIRGRFIVHDGNAYHEKCYLDHVALRCAICGGVIEGKYIYDHWGNVYHARHEGEYPRCDYCLRFICAKVTGGGTTYPDGRHICKICLKTAVADVREANALMEEVRDRLIGVGLDVRGETVTVHLADLPQLQALAGSHSPNVRGFTRETEVTYQPGATRTHRADVYLLRGMPRIDSIATMAHELTHVWQYFLGRRGDDRALQEGSCNYAAYLILKEYPGERSAWVIDNLMESRDRGYGEGFRRVKKFAEENGRGAWLDVLRSRDRLPDGY